MAAREAGKRLGPGAIIWETRFSMTRVNNAYASAADQQMVLQEAVKPGLCWWVSTTLSIGKQCQAFE